jgi:ABC-type transport system involved in multi-copper enzyme maturation permease subunit
VRALLALFIRSLKEDVRGRSTYIIRAALVMLVLFFLWVTHSMSRWSGAVGRRFFSSVMWVDLFVLSVVGLSYFASAITEEKENETLGLLRMTNLDALSILMGKSTGRLLGAIFILTAQLPFMLVAVTMGGLAVRQVLAGFVCLAGYVFLLSNVGLFCSVVSKRSSGATVLSGGVIFVLLVLPWWLYGSGQLANGVLLEQALDAWARATPFVQVNRVMWTGFNEAILGWQLVASLIAGLSFFGLAWLVFDRFADSSDESPGASFVAPFPMEMTPTRAFARRAESPALLWKDYHLVAGGSPAVVLKTLAVVVILLLCLPSLNWDTSGKSMVFGWISTIFTSLFLAFCLSLDASRIFKREREQRTLSSLLILPISTRRLVWQKTFGCLKASWPAIAGVGLGLTIFAFGALQEIGRQQSQGQPYWVRDFFFGSSVFAHAIFSGLLLPVFIAFLSLRMRWGALPVGLTIWLLGNFGAVVILGAIAEEGAFILLPILSFSLLFAFWNSIPAKIEQLAAEE